MNLESDDKKYYERSEDLRKIFRILKIFEYFPKTLVMIVTTTATGIERVVIVMMIMIDNENGMTKV